MVLLIDGDSFDKLHGLFFFCAGLSSSIFWSSLYNQYFDDDFYKTGQGWTFRAIFLIPLVIAFALFHQIRNLFPMYLILMIEVLGMAVLSAAFHILQLLFISPSIILVAALIMMGVTLAILLTVGCLLSCRFLL